MKTKCIIFAIMAMACSLAANAYVPLVREGVKWVYYYYLDWGPDHYEKEYHCEYSLEIKGDSVINGITYKKVFSQWLKSSMDEDAPNYGSDKPELCALVREVNKIVYIHLVPEEDIWFYEDLMGYYGFNPMVAGLAPNEWVLYDFNDINRPFSLLDTQHLYGIYHSKYPEFTYSETIQLVGESAKKYVGSDFPAHYIIEGLGYVDMYDGDWLYTMADFYQPRLSGYPRWDYELSYLADDDGDVLYKGKAYTYMCDVNRDFKVDGADLNRVIDYLLQDNHPWIDYLCDTNGDGEVDGADINEVINFILKK